MKGSPMYTAPNTVINDMNPRQLQKSFEFDCVIIDVQGENPSFVDSSVYQTHRK